MDPYESHPTAPAHIHRYLETLQPHIPYHAQEGHQQFLYEQENGFEEIQSHRATGDSSSAGQWSEVVLGKPRINATDPEEDSGEGRRRDAGERRVERRKLIDDDQQMEDHEYDESEGTKRRLARKMRRRVKAAVVKPKPLPPDTPPATQRKRSAESDSSGSLGRSEVSPPPVVKKKRRANEAAMEVVRRFRADNVTATRLTLLPSSAKGGFLSRGATSQAARKAVAHSQERTNSGRYAIPSSSQDDHIKRDGAEMQWSKPSLFPAGERRVRGPSVVPQQQTPPFSHRQSRAYGPGELPPPGRSNSPSWPSSLTSRISRQSSFVPPSPLSMKPISLAAAPDTNLGFSPYAAFRPILSSSGRQAATWRPSISAEVTNRDIFPPKPRLQPTSMPSTIHIDALTAAFDQQLSLPDTLQDSGRTLRRTQSNFVTRSATAQSPPVRIRLQDESFPATRSMNASRPTPRVQLAHPLHSTTAPMVKSTPRPLIQFDPHRSPPPNLNPPPQVTTTPSTPLITFNGFPSSPPPAPHLKRSHSIGTDPQALISPAPPQARSDRPFILDTSSQNPFITSQNPFLSHPVYTADRYSPGSARSPYLYQPTSPTASSLVEPFQYDQDMDYAPSSRQHFGLQSCEVVMTPSSGMGGVDDPALAGFWKNRPAIH